MSDEYPGSDQAAEPFKKFFSDRIVKKLLKNSDLTKIQFETLLINFAFDETAGRSGGMYDKKAQARTFKESFRAWRAKSYPKGVSRGAFRRVLFQACRNVVRSMYTLFLLGYVGVLDTPALHSYIELSDMITQYRKKMEEDQAQRQVPLGLKGGAMRLLEKSLLGMIDQYAFPFNVFGKTQGS